MSERMRMIRTAMRFALAFTLVVAVVVSTLLIVRELPEEPHAALIGLLGTIFGGLLTSLGFLVQAVSRNPSDQENGEAD